MTNSRHLRLYTEAFNHNSKMADSTILKELKRTTGQSVTDPEIVRLLNETVMLPECLDGK